MKKFNIPEDIGELPPCPYEKKKYQRRGVPKYLCGWQGKDYSFTIDNYKFEIHIPKAYSEWSEQEDIITIKVSYKNKVLAHLAHTRYQGIVYYVGKDVISYHARVLGSTGDGDNFYALGGGGTCNYYVRDSGSGYLLYSFTIELPEILEECKLSDFQKYGNKTYDVTEKMNKNGYSGKWKLEVYNPIEIVGKFSEKKTRPDKEIIRGWKAGYEIQYILCSKDNKYYGIKFGCKLIQMSMPCTLSDFKRYGNTDYPVTSTVLEYERKYKAMVGKPGKRGWILHVYEPVAILGKYTDKPLPRSTKAKVEGWARGEEIQRIFCQKDNKWYVIKFRCKLERTDPLFCSLQASATKVYVGQQFRLTVRASEPFATLIKLPATKIADLNMRYDPQSMFYVADYVTKRTKPGTYVFQAVVEDIFGNTKNSNTVRVDVEPAPPKPAPTPPKPEPAPTKPPEPKPKPKPKPKEPEPTPPVSPTPPKQPTLPKPEECKLMDFEQYGDKLVDVTEKMNAAGYEGEWSLSIGKPVKILGKHLVKKTRKDSEIIEGWKKGYEIQYILCSKDKKYYEIQFDCKLKKKEEKKPLNITLAIAGVAGIATIIYLMKR